MSEREIQEFKEKVNKNNRFMFGFVILAIMVGLYGVQERAKNFAADKATALAIQEARKDRIQSELDDKQDRYNISYQIYNSNRAACIAEGIVAPLIAKAREDLKTYRDAIKDPKIDEDARLRNLGRIKSGEKSIIDLKRFRSLYATIPPDLDCKDLPKNPPKRPKQ